jgi:hypothetical protein
MIARVDELTGPVEVGKIYLVPTVTAIWNNSLQAWPVIGPQHSDKQCLDFDIQHYHLDPRFLAKRSEDDELYWRHAMASPMQTHAGLNPDGLPAPVWRRRTCRRGGNPFNAKLIDLALTRLSGPWKCHFDMWTGKQARHDGRGWVCPHRSVPLADHAPIDGVITCPLHLLRIDAATGMVLPPSGAAE